MHWYGGAESIARRFGELAADGATQAEDLLGHQMAGPIDIFVYDSQDDFFGALGPGAREWTGAATYPAIRTIFMWLGAGPTSYLETAIVHEVTHVVFNDATENPFHEPAKWLNEGLATWSEQQNADAERSTVAFEASGGGLFSFDAISLQFPISDRGSRLAYAQGATMVDMIVGEHGRAAIAGIAAAYRRAHPTRRLCRPAPGISADDLYRGVLHQLRRPGAAAGGAGGDPAVKRPQARRRRRPVARLRSRAMRTPSDSGTLLPLAGGRPALVVLVAVVAHPCARPGARGGAVRGHDRATNARPRSRGRACA